jgi:hypothetical protein
LVGRRDYWRWSSSFGGWWARVAGWLIALARGTHRNGRHTRLDLHSVGQSKQAEQTSRPGFFCGSGIRRVLLSYLHENSCHTGGFNFNSEWLRADMRTTIGLVIS